MKKRTINKKRERKEKTTKAKETKKEQDPIENIKD